MKHIFQQIERLSLTNLKLPKSFRLSGSSVVLIAVCCLLAPRLQAQTFPTPGFTLPNGKTIIITYEVDVDADVCPTETQATDISNQSNVTGSNFSTVQTDEVAGAPITPTLTPVSSLTLGNLVYKDNNNNSVFDGGDAGINGVLLNLYADDGDGVLDAGDGAAIASATTAGGGLYTFTNLCPGDYIVEAAASNFNPGGALYDNGLSAALISSPVGGAPDPDNDVNNDDNGDQVAGFGVATAAITLTLAGEPITDGDADNNTNLSLDLGFKLPTIVTISDVTLNEGTGGSTTSFNFTVTRTIPDEAFSLTVNTSDGTATDADNDYEPIVAGTVSFTAGGSLMETVTVLVNHDNKVEVNETFTVLLSGAPAGVVISDATGLGTVTNDDNATVTLSGPPSQPEGNSGTTTYVFSLTLDNPVQGGFTINGDLQTGTATFVDGDFSGPDVGFTFTGNAGETKTMTQTIFGDLKVELDETFSITLGAPTGAPPGVTTAGSPATGVITNDDSAVITVSSPSVSEASGPLGFVVTLSNPVDVAVGFNFASSDGTATLADLDYNLTNGAFNVPAAPTLNTTVNVPVNNDNIVEANETMTGTLSALNASGRAVTFSGGGATLAGTGTITNDDAAVVTLSGGSSANEGNTGTTSRVFTATLNNPVQGGFTLPYTTNDGSATTADNDYVDNDGPALSFAGTMGEAKTISVLVNGDFKVEANETFTVELGAITGAPAGVTTAGSPQTGTIINDEVDWGDGPDSLPTLSFNNGARHSTVLGFQLGAAIDGDPDGQSTGGTHSNLANGDDTDAEGDDEDGVTLPSVFVIGTTATITVNASQAGKLDAFMDFNWNRQLSDAGEKIFNNVSLVAGDNVLTFNVPANAVVGSSFLRFRFSSAGGLSNSGLAADGEVEDYRTQIVSNQFSIDNPSVTEGNGGTSNLTFTVTRTTINTASSVDYAITGGTASSGSDYQPLAAGTLNFPMNGAMSLPVTVTVNGDLVVEDHETVIITLSNPVNGGIGANPGTGTITNDDAATLTLSGGAMLNETNGGTVAHTFTATLSAAVQGGFQVAYTTNDGGAVAPGDYTDNDGMLTFTGTVGETKMITVQANGDITVELNETFTENLGAISATTAVQAAAITLAGSPQTGTIVNDDAATVSIQANVSQAENLTPQVFTVTLSNPVDVAVTVLFNTSNGTATTTDNDYSAVTNQTVTFAANSTTSQTVNVTIVNDNKVEADEVYNVAIGTLSASGRNVALGTAARTGTITNEDAAVVTLSGGIAQNEGNSGTTPYTFTATLNNPVQGGFTANYSTNDGTATTANNDYQDNDGPALSFAGTAGEAKTFTVLVNGDLTIEANETFQTAINSLSGVVNPSAVTIAGSPQTATITNDEQDWGDAPTAAQSGFGETYPTLLADNGARHAAAVGGLKLGASLDADLDGQPNGTATGDGADEDGVTLPTASTIVINTTANITVNASGSGNLNAWADYNRDGDWSDAGEQVFTNQAVVAGNNALSFAVPNASLGNSFMRFRLTTAGGTGIDGAAADGEVEDYAITIVNTQFTINDPSVAEGNAGTTNLSFTVTRTVNANACSVDYAITGGTATTADNDYQVLAAGTINFTAGGSFTAPINVVVNGDVKVELNETVEMTLSNPVSGSILDGSGTGTITNDDAATITINNPVVTEGDAGTMNATFTISMSNPSDANVSLNYATVDGSATIANNDYTNTSGSHTFTPGQVSKTVNVPIVGDCTIEPNETYLLRLSTLTNNGRNVSLSGGGATLDGTGTINNDDALPVITCPTLLKVNVDPGVCTKSVTIPLPTTSSVCGASILEFRYRTVDALNNPTGSYNAYAPAANNTVVFTRGRYEIEWRITDGSGSSVCSFYLQVNDTQPPMIQCPSNQNINANTSCMGTVGSWNPVSLSDNCTAVGLITVTQTPPSSTILSGHNDSELVTLTANDGNGNTASCSFTVTLKDVTLPIAKCKNITANLGANGMVTVAPSAVNNGSSDNCTFTLSLTPNTFSCLNIGMNTVTLRATDAGGNTATCNAIVTVKDISGPNAKCKNPIIFLNDSGHATLTVAQVNDGSTDNCGIGTMSIDKTSFNCSEISGRQPVILSMTDVNGNSSSCISYVTVKDAIAPTAVCEDVTVELGSNGMVTVYGAELASASTDNCSVWSYSPIAKVYNSSNLGDNNLTITVKDWSGNAATCVSIVTVEPFMSPSPLAPGHSGSEESFRVDASDFAFHVYPNPTSGDVAVAFELPAEQPVWIRVFDLQGRLILSHQDLGLEGENTYWLGLKGLASGMYIVDFQSEDLKGQKRLVVQE